MAVTAVPGEDNLPDDPKEEGPPECQEGASDTQPVCGRPIHPGTGNMWEREVDYVSASGSLSIQRTYNSNPFTRDLDVERLFGTRSSQRYDVVLKYEPRLLPGLPGSCWRWEDDQTIFCETYVPPTEEGTQQTISIRRGDGKKYWFRYVGGTFVGDANVNDKVTQILDPVTGGALGWNYVSAQGDKSERYDMNGVLLSITDRTGTSQKLTYSSGATNDTSLGRYPNSAPACSNVQAGALLPAGKLLCVTDHWGRQLQYEYDEKGRIARAIDPAGQSYLYDYDGVSGGCVVTAATARACAPGDLECFFNGDPAEPACTANNLTKVTYPDGASKTYFYNEASQINGGTACSGATPVGNGFGHLFNALTGVIDENGVRHMSWTYDCLGRATSSQLAGGVEAVSLAYHPFSTTVTHSLGTAANSQSSIRTYNYQLIAGAFKNVSIDQPCVECGGTATRAYDANGNVTVRTDWNGNQTTYVYDPSRNLETSRTEAAGTPQARTIVTTWHPVYRLPLTIAEPGKVSSFTYDSSGNLLQRTITANGNSRTWIYTYNSNGQILTANGPRTDQPDITTYAYNSQGNLVTITNAAGHVTTLSNYDPHGRARRIVDANGLTTDLVFSPRGRLTSRSITGPGLSETISYSYDSVGQLKKVTFPNAIFLSYSYDNAHRLTGIANSAGNTIAYTLDLRGNRIRETVSDPTGALARQITRAFDVVSRLQQITGAAQ